MPELAFHTLSSHPILAGLALLSVLMWTLIIERYLYFTQARHSLATGNAFWKGLEQNYRRDLELDAKVAKDRLDEQLWLKENSAKRYLNSIAIFCAIAPLLGLLGTVGGMIDIFTFLGSGDTGGVRSLSGGISRALISTQLGLCVAIPGLFALHDLKRRRRRINMKLTQGVKHLLLEGDIA